MLSGTAYEVEVDAFAGSPTARFRVVATDGGDTGFAESAPVSIPNKAPYPVIVNQEPGDVYAPGRRNEDSMRSNHTKQDAKAVPRRSTWEADHSLDVKPS